MTPYNTKNIKDLPELEEIIDGNYLIVENDLGTNILNFENFVIGPNNASFYNTIVSLCSRSISMSATVDSKNQTLSSNLYEELNNRIDSLTANYPRYFITYPETLTILQGSRYGQKNFNSPFENIVAADLNVIPINDEASRTNWVLLLSSTVYPGSPEPYTFTVTISSKTVVAGDAAFDLKVMARDVIV